MVKLKRITRENVKLILDLDKNMDEDLVAPNELSIAEWALRDDAWMRAIYDNDTPVGFVMIQDIPDYNIYTVWRLMIGEKYQKKGYGRSAMEQVIEKYKKRPGAYLMTTWVVDKGNAEEFYKKLGFKRNGHEQMGEFGMTLEWGKELKKDQWPEIPKDAIFTLEPIRSGTLRIMKRIYESLPENTQKNVQSPLIKVTLSEFGKGKEVVKAVCANEYPIGFAICDSKNNVKQIHIAAPYKEKGINIDLSNVE